MSVSRAASEVHRSVSSDCLQASFRIPCTIALPAPVEQIFRVRRTARRDIASSVRQSRSGSIVGCLSGDVLGANRRPGQGTRQGSAGSSKATSRVAGDRPMKRPQNQRWGGGLEGVGSTPRRRRKPDPSQAIENRPFTGPNFAVDSARILTPPKRPGIVPFGSPAGAQKSPSPRCVEWRWQCTGEVLFSEAPEADRNSPSGARRIVA